MTLCLCGCGIQAVSYLANDLEELCKQHGTMPLVINTHGWVTGTLQSQLTAFLSLSIFWVRCFIERCRVGCRELLGEVTARQQDSAWI